MDKIVKYYKDQYKHYGTPKSIGDTMSVSIIRIGERCMLKLSNIKAGLNQK
jgi:hypothetical protein